MSVKVCWRVLRRETIQEDGGYQDSPWEEWKAEIVDPDMEFSWEDE